MQEVAQDGAVAVLFGSTRDRVIKELLTVFLKDKVSCF